MSVLEVGRGGLVTRGWVLALTIATVCAPVACRRPVTAAERPERPRPSSPRDPYLIEGDEFKVANANNLYDVVRIQRPAWLTRTVGNWRGNDAIVVYMNGRLIGQLNVLRQMPPNYARRLQFLSASEAVNRFGSGHGNLLAIVVEPATY